MDSLIADLSVAMSNMDKKSPWTLEEAIEVCRKVESFCPEYGCHVALTGGCLYKDGPRKDLDILFYRIRQIAKLDIEGLVGRLCVEMGWRPTFLSGWIVKFTHIETNKTIDTFFPAEDGDFYPGHEESEPK